jgi:DNA-binding transcriptional MerR regulator
VKGYLRIGEVAKLSGLDPRTIRYYEEMQVVPAPRRTPADHGPGDRQFLPGDVHRLTFVRRARELGLSLAEIKELLKTSNGKGKEAGREKLRRLIEDKLAAIEHRIRELERLRENFKRMKRQIAVTVLQDGCCDPLCGPGTCR